MDRDPHAARRGFKEVGQARAAPGWEGQPAAYAGPQSPQVDHRLDLERLGKAILRLEEFLDLRLGDHFAALQPLTASATGMGRRVMLPAAEGPRSPWANRLR